MVLEEDIKEFSKEYKLPGGVIRREIEEYDRFVAETDANEPERESDPVVVERLMAECTHRAEATVVPYVRLRYLYQSACYAAMYIFKHDDDWRAGNLPAFYETVLKQSVEAVADFDFDHLLVRNMLQLFGIRSVDIVIDCVGEVRRYVTQAKKYSSYFISKYRQDELYKRFEVVCMQVGYEISKVESLSLNKRIQLLRYLTKLHGKEILMRIYFILYRLYYDKIIAGKDNDDYDRKTGYMYFEIFLQKAYTAMSFDPENIDLSLYDQRNWLKIAVEYAYIVSLNLNGLIPYDPEEAERILRCASAVDDPGIAALAQAYLQKFYND